MNWLSFKVKMYAFGGLLLTALAFVARFAIVKHQRDRFKRDAETYKAQAGQAQAVIDADAEIEQEFSDLEREAKQDLDNDEMPDTIRDRNDF